MTTTWAVTHGAYSDYTVHAIFATEDQAHKHASLLNAGSTYESYRVEEFPYYPAGDEPEIVTVWSASAEAPDFEVTTYARSEPDYDGDVQQLRAKRRPEVHVGTVPDRRVPRLQNELGQIRVPRVSAVGLDREVVVKVVSDKAAELKAQEAGL